MSKIKACITGVAGYVPDNILTNADLEKMVDTTNEWIIERTGIKERRILKGEGLGTSYMGIKAAQKLLEVTNTKPEEIESILCATVTPDMHFPATANIIASGIKAYQSFGFDIEAACCSFLYALETGVRYIESGRYKKIMIIGADKMSSIVDYTDRSSCIIFGDGAGAVMLEPAKDENYIVDTYLRSDGDGEKHLHMAAGGSRKPSSLETIKNKQHIIYQNGPIVFKNAVSQMKNSVEKIMKNNNLDRKDIAYLIPHQANYRIIRAIARFMELDMEKVTVNIFKYGNTTSATIPLCLEDYKDKFKKGDNLILVAFGGGFTLGGMYLKWAM